MDRQKITSTMLIVLEAILLIAVLVGSILFNNTNGGQQPSGGNSVVLGGSEDSEEETSTDDSQGNSESNGGWFSDEVRETFSAEVEEILAAMTTEQKVAQLFLTTPEELTGVDRVTISGNGTRDALNTYPVAGFIYAQKNFVSMEQANELINGAQGYSIASVGAPLFVMIREDAAFYAGLATLNLTAQEKGALAMEIGTPSVAEGIQTCTYTNTLEIVAAVKSGMNMIYAPDNFKEIYGAVLDAVRNGTITQLRLENAVGKVLTEKLQ